MRTAFHRLAKTLDLLPLCLATTLTVGCSSKDEPTEAATSDAGSTGGQSGYQLDASAWDADAATNCGGSKLQAEPRPVNVVVLLDRSLSMNTPLSAAQATTRWQAMREALKAALTATQNKISFGLKLFPDSTGDCTVAQPGLAVAPGLGASAVAEIDQAIADAIPAGGTPVSAALDQLIDYYSLADAATLAGDNVVLLATDGAPNCNGALTCEQATCIANIENPEQTQNICQYDPAQCLDATATIAKVKALQDRGIGTVVLGIPGTEYAQYREILNQMALAGGLFNGDPNFYYYPVSADAGVQGLTSTLERITKGLIKSCLLQLTSVPQDYGLLNVSIDGVRIPQSGMDGWDVDQTTSPPTVVLKGSTCGTITTRGAESVEIIYGCPTVIF